MKAIIAIFLIVMTIVNVIAMKWQHETGEWNMKAALRHVVTEIKCFFKD